ncbi:MAG: hypothetical protein HUU03_09765 [Planctomycetaceae bacterium]|nr:hypothetical protein [Planctomycetota bacterium]MCQ3948649.1 hypothetical protein [Planctomycetota bacterium]NUO16714.1 hypothetical protein [Planctomycetaceae bacterium]GIK51747.1 MAG: hypothetical protein BroJett014_07200 [Planctomycetota bacterium]HRJ79817.1 DUF6064 family protein [Planctomycetota bacterium]
MAPLTLEQVLRVAAEYNRQISPLQVLIYVPTLLVFVLLIRGTRQDTSRGVLLLLASQWGIVGVLFFLLHLAKVHILGYAGAAFFVASAVYYAALASRPFPPQFHWKPDAQSWLSVMALAFGIFGYPALSFALGRGYPATLTYGLMPGSVAVLSLGVLLAARPAPRLLLLVPPLLWIMTAPFSIWRWGLWEDAALPLLGAMGVAGSLLWRSRLSGLDVKDTVRFDF